MTDFLHNLAQRSLQMADSVQPRLPALFESNPYGPRMSDEPIASVVDRLRSPNPGATPDRRIGDAAAEPASGHVRPASPQLPQEQQSQRIPVAHPDRDERDMPSSDTVESIQRPLFQQPAQSFRPSLQPFSSKPSHPDSDRPPVIPDVAVRISDRGPAERAIHTDDGSTRDRNLASRSIQRIDGSEGLSQDNDIEDVTPTAFRVDKGPFKPHVKPQTACADEASQPSLDYSIESARTHSVDQGNADRSTAIRSAIDSTAAIGLTQPNSTGIQPTQEKPAADLPVIGMPVQPLLPPALRQLPPAPKEPVTLISEPTINVTIGRIEVKATPAAPPKNKGKKRRANTPVVSLDDYLRQQAGGGS